MGQCKDNVNQYCMNIFTNNDPLWVFSPQDCLYHAEMSPYQVLVSQICSD